MRRFVICAWLVFAMALGSIPAGAGEAEQVLQATGVKGGLVVHLGCGDGKLTAALRANDRYVVHGLDADPANVAAARKHVQSLGLYGPVSVALLRGSALPFADNLVNLVVAESLGKVSMDEILRVLAPEGVAYVRADGGWKKTVKPRPKDIGEWTHYLCGPSNNAVAQDTRVGSPRRLQWVVGPMWCRSHEFVSSFAAMVSAGGRTFYVMDEGLPGVTDRRLPERWTLTARGAFNGVLLWSRPLPQWRAEGWKNSSLRGRPGGVPRRLVADARQVYATFGHAEPLTVLDAATGEIVRTVEGTDRTEEILLHEGTVVLRIAPGPGKSGAVAAVDAGTGALRWRTDTPQFTPQSLAAAKDRVIFHNRKETVCLALADGKPQWRAGAARQGGRPKNVTIILHEDAVLETTGSQIVARELATGKPRWTAKTGGGSMRSHVMFVAQGLAWHAAGSGIAGYGLKTGKVAKTIDASSVQTPGHHLRCYDSKATERFLITAWRGAEFISLTDDRHAQNDWLRGPCRYGLMPANGMLYAPPHQCFCYPGVTEPGLKALTAASDAEIAAIAKSAPTNRLERGPAYGKVGSGQEVGGSGQDWPTYRHDPRRLGATPSPAPASLDTRWTVKLTGPVTPPVVADGRLYVAAKDTHTLHAFDAASGKPLWSHVAGGRIDSPPTVFAGRVLFGSADGRVTSLRAADGALDWRFRAAPSDQLIMAFDQLESPWRVHGSVLVQDGLVYCTAGRSTFMDGGIWVYALDPNTGAPVHQRRLDSASPTRVDAVDKPYVPAYHMEGARSDILVSQGGFIYLGQYKLDKALAEQDVPYVMDPKDKTVAADMTGTPYANPKSNYEKHQRQWIENTQKAFVAQLRAKHGGYNIGHRKMGLHLLATSGFLDDTWFNRTYWMYSESWPGFYLADRAAKTGHLLVVGPERTYSVVAYTTRNLQSPMFTPGQKGYLLQADANDNEPVMDHRTRETTKGWGFTRAKPPVWYQFVPVRMRAMVLAGKSLVVAGPPDVVPGKDPMATYDGRAGGTLWALSAADGKKLAELKLEHPPVFDGLIAANGRLYLSLRDGSVLCLGEK